MELNEAVRRILGRHKGIITVFVVIGCLLGAALHIGDDRLYAATARLVLDAQDPQDQAESQAIADTARGIVTGPSLIRSVLTHLSISRDPRTMAKRYVTVEALGSSGVLALKVTDRDPHVAVALANGLAEAVIATRQGIGSDQVATVFQEIDEQVADLTGQIGSIDDTLDSLARRIAAATSAQTVRTLEAIRNDLESQRSYLEQRRVTLEAARANVTASQAQRPQASIVDPAILPAEPVPPRWPPSAAVGFLLGLLLGVAVAAATETLSPTVVGKTALERETGAPLLGELSEPPDRVGGLDLTTVASHVALASATARVSTVALMATDRDLDLTVFATQLSGSIQRGSAKRLDIVAIYDQPDQVKGKEPAPLGEVPNERNAPSTNGHRRSGVVLITPAAVKRTSLDPVLSFRTFSGSPLLGVILYRDRGFGRSRPASRARATVQERADAGRSRAQGSARRLEHTPEGQW